MKLTLPVRILAVAALAILALVALVAHESLARAQGTEVILRMGAVDPRALLSGHYVAVDTTEPLPAGQSCPPGSQLETAPSPDRRIAGEPERWLALVRAGDRFVTAGAAPDRVAAARLAPLVVRGRVYCSAPAAPDSGEAWPGSVSLRLGVGRFYVSQAEATRISALLSPAPTGADSPVSAIVSVGRDGRARLKGLLVKGRRVDFSLF